MIDPKELRIGNLVAVSGRTFEVIGLGPYLVHLSGPTHPDLIDPIPITPEWLERVGFEKEGNQWAWNEQIWVRPEDDDWGDDMWLDTYHRWNYPSMEDYQKVYLGTNPCFVHLMQNLIFALTGSELTVKETTETK